MQKCVLAHLTLNEGGEVTWLVWEIALLVEFVKGEGLEVHDVSDVERRNPVVCVFQPQSASDTNLELALCLQTTKFLKGLERNVHPLFLGHAIPEILGAELCSHLRDGQELLEDLEKLLHGSASVS